MLRQIHRWSTCGRYLFKRNIIINQRPLFSQFKRFNHHTNDPFITTNCGLRIQTDFPKPFNKILIANRGEIACRIIRTCRVLGVKTVAIYSDADAQSMHTQMADESYYIGKSEPSESYLNMNKILEICKQSNAEAVHPGYGFLSENSRFCDLLFANNIEFIGPPSDAMQKMGDKSQSKFIMQDANVPVVPGYHGSEQSLDHFKSEASRIGYPVMLKAVAGGGGKGIRPVFSEDTMEDLFQSCKKEALDGFSNDALLIEKYVPHARHIEFQVFCDKFGNGVHLYERDCSVQRGNQKVFEESPAPGLTNELRNKMGQSAVDAALACNYVGAGTVEFLVDPDTMDYYFMEMNTRLQVEHPVTEMIVNRDLVQWQLHAAAGYPLPVKQSDIESNGHAIEARIYAEDSVHFLPSSGKIHHLLFPNRCNATNGPISVRVETGVRPQDTVTAFYDAMIAKLIVHTSDNNNNNSSSDNNDSSENKDKDKSKDMTRRAALDLMNDCLGDFQVSGLKTNIDFLKRVIEHPKFIEGGITTDFIPQYRDDLMIENVTNNFAVGLTALAKVLFERNFGYGLRNPSQFSDDGVRHPWITKDDNFCSFRVNGITTDSNARQRMTLFDENYDGADTGNEYEITLKRDNDYFFIINVDNEEIRVLNASIEEQTTDLELMGRECKFYTLRVKTPEEQYDCNVSFYDNICSIFINGLRYDFLTEREIELEYPPEFYSGEGGILIAELPDLDSPMIPVKSKMPCKVTEVLVKKGDSVVKGQLLMKTFAMKMEHEVTSKVDGTVESVAHDVDAFVAKGETLCKIARSG